MNPLKNREMPLLTAGPLRGIFANETYVTEAMAAQLDVVPLSRFLATARIRLHGVDYLIGIDTSTKDLALAQPPADVTPDSLPPLAILR